MKNTKFNMVVSFIGWVAFMAAAVLVTDSAIYLLAAVITSMVFLVSGFVHVAILEAVQEIKNEIQRSH